VSNVVGDIHLGLGGRGTADTESLLVLLEIILPIALLMRMIL
jgi:hypothetical protein